MRKFSRIFLISKWRKGILFVSAAVFTYVLVSIPSSTSNENERTTRKNVISSSYKFSKRDETSDIICGKLLANDEKYIQTMIIRRRKMRPTKSLNMSCEAIRNRIIFTDSMRTLNFGVSFLRNVFKNYELIEEQIRAHYHPQNFFCFSIDIKSSSSFKMKIGILSSCIENIFVAPVQYDMTSNGSYTNHAHLDCMKLLIEHTGWKYALLLQNHDVVLKSTYELVEIYQHLSGANDMQLCVRPSPKRWNASHGWTPKKLGLFNNGEYYNENGVPDSVLNRNLTIGKGAIHMSLSREAIQWLTETLDLTQIMKQFNSMSYGVDEQLFQTLHVNSQLNMPGGFTDECMKKGVQTEYISRFRNSTDEYFCRTGYEVHFACIYGVEDFASLAAVPHISVNKMLPEFDYGIIDCIHELMFNRTFLSQNDHPLRYDVYDNMVNVLYHKHKIGLIKDVHLNCNQTIN